MRILLVLLMIFPGLAFAAGGAGTTFTSPPTSTKTTKTCKGVMVWDEKATEQWSEIKARGGEGTWAEASLRSAIRDGKTFDY